MAEEPPEGSGSEGQSEGPEWTEVDSTAVESVGWDEENGLVLVRWRNGAESAFPGDRSLFEGLAGAGSVGRAVNELLGHSGTGGRDVGA